MKPNVITEDSYILSCIEYIHNNPVRAKIVNKAEDYQWSSYHFYQGKSDPLKGYIALDRFKE